jgi:hypothetical protein
MANIYDMTDTWNNGATTFTAIKMDVSDSASAANSLLLDLKVDGVTKASIDKAGNLTANITLTSIDNVPIGATTPSTGAFTTLTASTADINGGTIDNAVIGGSTAAAGTFTTLSASGDVNFDSNTLFVDASENKVGIGTSSPAAPLSVYNASNPYANFADAANYLNVGVVTSNYGAINSSLPISFQVSDVERARIDSAGTLITNHNIREKIYNLTGTDINPVNGAIQYKTLGANTTFTESLSDGDSVILRLSGGDTYAVTYPTMTWVTSAGNTAPTLGGSDVIVIWQESSVLYGAYVGSYA